MKRATELALVVLLFVLAAARASAQSCSALPLSADASLGDDWYGSAYGCNATLEQKFYKELGMDKAGSGWSGNWGRTALLRCNDNAPYKRTLNAVFLLYSTWQDRYDWVA